MYCVVTNDNEKGVINYQLRTLSTIYYHISYVLKETANPTVLTSTLRSTNRN